MEIKSILRTILTEIDETVSSIRDEEITEFAEAVRNADRIFVAGTGRALLMIKPLAMRLMQFGREAYVVGETITPAIAKEDLLIIASGSGTTSTMQAVAGRCKQAGASLALITTMPDSPIAQKADHVLTVPAATTKNSSNERKSHQFAASTFEQCVLLLGDALIQELFADMDLSGANSSLMRRHANLE